MLSRRLNRLTLGLRSFGVVPGNGIDVNHNSQLRVMHTNQWPIPYYERQNWVPRSLYPENDYNVTIMNNEVSEPDHVNVFQAERYLKKFMWGREVLDTVQKLNLKGTLNTRINSPKKASEIYLEDLLQHIDAPARENARILKKHKLSNIFD
jgi:hypothetical protein